MSLLGIDVGTTTCKVAAFSAAGEQLGSSSVEYDIQRPQPGWAELDAATVLSQIRTLICRVVAGCSSDPVTALSVSSMGEAVVPVQDRTILGPSILNFDVRGAEYVEPFRQAVGDERLYRINGNSIGNHFGLTKLKWIQEHAPQLYERADYFLLWSAFVAFMLGAEPVVDYTLANRTLLFDLDHADWSDELLRATGLARDKLPRTVPPGTVIGHVAPGVAAELGLGARVAIISGAHDQCANALGCGVIAPGLAVYGMGTFICITPVFDSRREPSVMLARGLNTEHHVVPGHYVSFMYNQGGSAVKWFRDTFAPLERRELEREGRDVYDRLFAEMPEGLSPVLACAELETFGLLSGLKFTTTRGEILKALVEGLTFDLETRVESLPPTGIEIQEFRAAGGGSKSEAWLQIAADIMGRPLVRPLTAEAGALGGAMLAGIGSGALDGFDQAVQAMVRLGRRFEPDAVRERAYDARLEEYQALKTLARANISG